MLSAILYVVDAAGERLDKALRKANGGFYPTVIKLGTGLKAGTAVRNGSEVEAPIEVDTAVVATVNSKAPILVSLASSGDSSRVLGYWTNTSAESVTVAGLGFTPTDNITANDTDRWLITLALASNTGTPLLKWNTKTTGSGGQGALTAGTRVSLVNGSNVSTTTLAVPAGDTIVVSVDSSGSPAYLGLLLQGLVPLT